jgi:hypothetical protein
LGDYIRFRGQRFQMRDAGHGLRDQGQEACRAVSCRKAVSLVSRLA